MFKLHLHVVILADVKCHPSNYNLNSTLIINYFHLATFVHLDEKIEKCEHG